MHWFALGVALLAAAAIIAIGIGYLANPSTMTRSFGLPLPPDDAATAWWLRLKGVRDIVSGLVLLTFIVRGGPADIGIVMLMEAAIPIGDMLIILSARGSAKRAFGIHGLTALLMLSAATPLMIGVA